MVFGVYQYKNSNQFVILDNTAKPSPTSPTLYLGRHFQDGSVFCEKEEDFLSKYREVQDPAALLEKLKSEQPPPRSKLARTIRNLDRHVNKRYSPYAATLA